MRAAPGKREAMRGEDAHAVEPAEPLVPPAEPSWIWRGLLCLAVVCAVIGVTIAIAPELFLPDRHATLVRVRP